MRYRLLDEIRGATLVSMLLYHACWDLVHIFQVKAPWYESRGAFYWQQSICWTFIFLSGFCWHLSKNQLKHALTIFLGGAVITGVTLLFAPEAKVVFGILTFLGSASFIVILLNNILKYLNPPTGFFLNMLLFGLTYPAGAGIIGIPGLFSAPLPGFLYRNLFTTYLGFRSPGFFSTDYFPVIPWLFMYIAGYYLYLWMKERDQLKIFDRSLCPPLGFLGRHSFLIYMIHQPLLYGLLALFFIDF